MKSKNNNRRRFLSDAVKYGALLAGGASMAETIALNEATAGAQTTSADVGRDVKEKVEMLRIFAVARRAPGLTSRELRGKGYIPLLSYGTRALMEAMKSNDRRQALLFLQNFVNDHATGADGQTECPSLSDRHFVAEYCMGIGKTVVGSVSGEIPPVPTDEPPPKESTPTRAGRIAPGMTMPEYVEAGTDIRIAARQVLAEGTRPLAVTGREKGMYFIKMSSTVPAADRVKVWQDLHNNALAATPLFKNGLVGFELLQRIAGTPDRAPQRCGADVPVPDLVACYWVKTKPTVAQFSNYVRNLRKADTQKALDGPSSFILLVEEWEVFMNPTFVA